MGEEGGMGKRIKYEHIDQQIQHQILMIFKQGLSLNWVPAAREGGKGHWTVKYTGGIIIGDIQQFIVHCLIPSDLPEIQTKNI